MDVALHRLPVTFVLDRAGITGDDGASHHGMWDLALLGVVPGMRVAAPRDAEQLASLLAECVATDDGPTALRFPKAAAGAPIASVGRLGEADVLVADVDAEVLLVAVGPLAAAAVEAASLLRAAGVHATVVDPRWVLPVDPAMVALAGGFPLVVTAEDGVRDGGVGEAIARELRDASYDGRVVTLGLDKSFVPHGRRDDLLAAAGLDASGIAAAVMSARPLSLSGRARGEVGLTH
jgi:1-deoxy-D-xylulose-5-phosphate synthase